MTFDQNEAVDTAPDQEITAAPDAVDNQPEEQEPRTFTQEELDEIVGKRLAKAERKWQREQAQRAEQTQQPIEAPRPDQFTTAEDYVEALAEHKAAQKLAEREAQQQRKQADSTYAEREESVREKYTDFEDVAYNPDLRITPAMAEVIKESEVGPELAYHLGKNPKEAARIADLSPLAQAREIGKIEASLVATPPTGKKASSAPEPIKPVGSRTSTPKYDTTDPRSVTTMSASDWIKARNAEIAKQRS